MSDEDEARAGRRGRRVRRWRRLAFALLVLLAVVLAAAWLQRRTIARGFVDRELARRGVPARYTIEQLSPWRQRLTNIVLGDPRHPDLVADWIELRTALYPWRADLLVAKAGTVRINGRIVDGTLSLGALDRLLPPPSGKPFALPRLSVEVGDAQLRLESAAGPLTLGLSGRGLLTDGFAGTIRADAPRLELGQCAVTSLGGKMRIRIRHGAPSIAGPLAAREVSCGPTRLAEPRADVRADLDAALARWTGRAQLATDGLATAGGRAASATGDVDFAGDAQRTAGGLTMRADALATDVLRAGSAALTGRYVFGQATGFAGSVAIRDAAVADAVLGRITGARTAAAGTPIAPLVPRLTTALTQAGKHFDATAALDLLSDAKGTTLRVQRATLAARSGARLRFDGGQGMILGLPTGSVALAGQVTLHGGGLPDAALRLAQTPGSHEFHGIGEMRPYAAGGASLGLARINVRIRGDAGTFETIAALSGPIGPGRVQGLSMPVAARWNGARLAVNARCETLAFGRVAAAGMVLNEQRLRICPLGGAMLGWDGRKLTGGIELARAALTGTMGESPLRVEAGEVRLDWRRRAFALATVALRLGADRPTRLDLGQVQGSFGPRLGGTFEGLGGQIGAVPLVLSQGRGKWQVENGDLALVGGFRLADAESAPRFEPLLAPEGRLRLHDGRIEARAELVGTKRPVTVAKVTVTHDLAKGEGAATLDVPGLRFRTDGLQPIDLTPLTLGVIADVDGLVAGTGRIAWSGDTVTSSGRFSATNIALAAAFGPVQGLTTTLDFTDLLNVRTAPGQRADVAEINPGVPVRNGVFRYQLLDSRRVLVEGARWPFAGGELVLDPTTLDFNEAGERRMTFHVRGVDAALFLKEMAFDNLDATGTFDGTLPMIFDANGGRIEGGELRARAGGHIAYVGEVSRENLGTWGDMAFQALKSLDYRNLSIRMNGPLAGEMITDISFSGLSQGAGTKSNFLIRRLARLPLVFNVRINAPFRQLLDSVQSWYDPRRLIERNLPALLEEQKRAEEAGKPVVQTRESAP